MNEQDRNMIIDAMGDEPAVTRDRRWACAVMAAGVMIVWIAAAIQWLA